jgi:hypothetical protein
MAYSKPNFSVWVLTAVCRQERAFSTLDKTNRPLINRNPKPTRPYEYEKQPTKETAAAV